ncbi:hypothetical protein SLNHY_3348 [Streptomyces albus]|nr:hypothetical protein SLNHY_3348 [Streptomyces albus]
MDLRWRLHVWNSVRTPDCAGICAVRRVHQKRRKLGLGAENLQVG